MGPTASGKTSLAIEIVQQFPCEIISVDSAMVYKGMDIGTAKPSKEILQIAPHRLIDLVDPVFPYSAGCFRRDALLAIKDIVANGKIPLLVGGTMLYFKILQQGLAQLPQADPSLRQNLYERGMSEGWEKLHAELSTFDKAAADKIKKTDSQRIQRALEVYYLTGQPISTLQHATTNPLQEYEVINIGLMPQDRTELHAKIKERFMQMLALGFVAEVEQLYQRKDLSPSLPSIRSIGYLQIWHYLTGQLNYEEMSEKAIVATRQLAKRQITWLRSWPNLQAIHSEDTNRLEQISHLISV